MLLQLYSKHLWNIPGSMCLSKATFISNIFSQLWNHMNGTFSYNFEKQMFFVNFLLIVSRKSKTVCILEINLKWKILICLYRFCFSFIRSRCQHMAKVLVQFRTSVVWFIVCYDFCLWTCKQLNFFFCFGEVLQNETVKNEKKSIYCWKVGFCNVIFAFIRIRQWF